MMVDEKKEYEFDKKLISNDIKFIDREEFNRFAANVQCDRHKGLLKRFVVTIRIDDKYYQIGDDCYNSIKNKLSEIRGKSLYHIRIDLEEGYDRFLEKRRSEKGIRLGIDKGIINKHHQDYIEYEALKWDAEQGNLPKSKMEMYEQLKEKFSTDNSKLEDVEIKGKDGSVSSKVSEEQYDARKVVFDEFWSNEIDFETFKEKIEEVDRPFRARKENNLN